MRFLLHHAFVCFCSHAGRLIWCALLLCGIAAIPGKTYSDVASTPLPSSGVANPAELVCGALNTLSGVSPTDAQVAIEMNFERLSNTINPDFEVAITFLEDVKSTVALIRQRKVHVLITTGIDYLLLRQVTDVMPLVVASKLADSPLDSYVVLARKGTTLKDLVSMKKRRLVVDSSNPLDMGRIWLETALKEKGLAPLDQTFTDLQVAKKPMRIVLPVFFGRADAYLVLKSAYDTMVDLNPQIGQKLDIVTHSPGFIKNLVCVVDYLDPDLVAQMDATLREMHTTQVGRQVLVIFQLQRNFAFKPEYLEETERVFDRYRQLNPQFSVQ